MKISWITLILAIQLKAHDKSPALAQILKGGLHCVINNFTPAIPAKLQLSKGRKILKLIIDRRIELVHWRLRHPLSIISILTAAFPPVLVTVVHRMLLKNDDLPPMRVNVDAWIAWTMLSINSETLYHRWEMIVGSRNTKHCKWPKPILVICLSCWRAIIKVSLLR